MPNTREKLIELLSIVHECPDGRNPFIKESCSTCPYGKAENCGAEMQADRLIANGVTVQKWIPVTERLPENDTYILVTTDGVTASAYWHNDRFYAFTASGVATVGCVTHWMPLPEPPGGE